MDIPPEIVVGVLSGLAGLLGGGSAMARRNGNSDKSVSKRLGSLEVAVAEVKTMLQMHIDYEREDTQS